MSIANHMTWNLEQDRARLATPHLGAQLDLEQPALGLHAISVNGQRQAVHSWLGIDLTGPPPGASEIDAYVRGNDLIATYAETALRPLRAQVYWRFVPCELAGTIATVELLVSVQTSLLDACPRLVAHSTIPESEVLVLDSLVAESSSESLNGGAVRGHLVRPREGEFSYVELAIESASGGNRLESAGGPQRLVHELFVDWLEKGVILKTRIRGVVVERAHDLDTASLHMADFVAAPLPLTT